MLQQAEQIKEEGNGYFKGKNFSAAIDSYSRAIDILSDFEKLDVNEKEKSAENEGSKALAVNHANRALCRILIQDFAGAVEDCNKALSIQPGYTKALYRRAKAFQGMGEPAKSMEDLTKLIHLEPKNSQAKDLASEVKDSLMKMNSKINSVDEIMTQLNRMKIPVNKESMSEGIQWIPRLLSRFENDKISKVEIINKYKAVNFFLKNIIDVHSILDWRVACIKAIVTILNGVKEFADIRVAIAQNINSENDFALVRNLVTLYLETARNIKEIEDSSSQKNLVKLTKDLSKGTRMVICLFSESLEYAQIRSIILEDLSRSFAHYDSQLPVEMNVFQNLLDLFEGVAARSVAGVLSQENSVSPFILDSEIRTMFLKKLVTSNALTYPKLKEQIVSAVVLCSGRPQAAGKVDPTTLDNYDRNNNEKDRESFDEDLHDRCKNIIIPLLVSQTSKDFVIGLKALSCLLQANPKVGHMIINEEKILARVVEIAVVHPFPENEFAAEVLALASSDTTVRNAVAEGGYTEIFLDLLEAKDDVVKSHAGIALAKLAPVDTAIGELLLKKNRHLRAMMSIISSFVNLKPIPSEISKPVQLALEAIAYLSIYVETKKALAVENNGMWFKSILKLTDLNDRSMNYGIAQITSNLTTNVDDMKAEYESEIEQLKQVASKGLNINRERDVIKSRAGSPDEIATVRAQIVECGVVRALFNAFHQPNGQSEGIQKMSENVQMAVARTLLRLSSQGNGELRGKLVQQRALRLLVDLFQSKSERCRNDSALALARIAISTNPNLYPTGVAEDICLPILKLLKDATHELHQFECLLALTNLASMNEMIRERLWNADAWYTLRMMLTSENWKVQVAALECQVNMIMCEKAVAKLASPSGNQDIQIFLAFARSGDLQGMTAACGALAMISHDEEIAKKMIKFGGLEQLQLTAKCGIPELEARAKVAVENLEIIDLSKIVITPEEAAEIASIHQRMMDAISSPAKDEEDDDE